jgi:HSP20 family protein
MSTLVTLPKNGKDASIKNNYGVTGFSSWVDELFDTNFGKGVLTEFNPKMTLPPVNILENPDEFKLQLAIPGFNKSDFIIDLENNLLSISIEVENNNEELKPNYTLKEFGFTSFKRTFTLPDTVAQDKIEASYIDGILEIKLPKREEAKQKPPKRIEIL